MRFLSVYASYSISCDWLRLLIQTMMVTAAKQTRAFSHTLVTWGCKHKKMNFYSGREVALMFCMFFHT